MPRRKKDGLDRKLDEETEVRLGRVAVGYLKAHGWTIYQEVRLGRGLQCIDIVGTRGSLLLTCECKLRLGVPVLTQAERHRPFSNLCFVAVSVSTSWRRSLLVDFADYLGIGVLVLPAWDDGNIRQEVRPRFRRRVDQRYRGYLYAEQKNYAPAGNNWSGSWAAWRSTLKAAQEFITARPGCTIKELAGGIRHHYYSTEIARQGLYQWIKGGLLGARQERGERNRILLYEPNGGWPIPKHPEEGES